jgi:thiol-disulfide isomerase/thioredoxin
MMKRLNYLTVFVVLLMNNSCLSAQSVKVISFKTLQTMFNQPNDTTYIVNFFASWCAPCVRELPEFMAFAEAYKTEKVQVIYVSLDSKKDAKKKLGPLSIWRETTSRTSGKLNFGRNLYLLDETNANNWINQIDSTWGGDIPATLFVNHQKHFSKLFAQSFTKNLLFQTFLTIK